MRQFLTSTETAIFSGNEGEPAFTANGPCKSASDAFQRATQGHDADHVHTVIRCDLTAGTCEDVTRDCGDDLAYWIASEDPIVSVPAFVDADTIDGFNAYFDHEASREYDHQRALRANL